MIAFAPGGFELPLPVITLGLIIGMTYGLLSVGLVLVYRTNRIVNFAHGEIGAFAAVLFGTAVVRWHVPYYIALPFALAAAGGVAALAEVAVVRRLRNAPRLMSIVATLGVGQFLVFFSAAFNPQGQIGYNFPSPPGMPEFSLGSLNVTQAYTGMLVFGPIVVGAVTLFLRRSRYGRAIRCASENPEAARMAGIFASRMSSLTWAIAGGVSALTAILVFPSRGFSAGETFGPSLLLRALAGAVIAKMDSLPRALAAGLGIGVVEQLLLWNYPKSNLADVVLFVIILGALLLQRGLGTRESEKGSWTSVQGWRPLPDAIRRLPEIRWAGWALGAVGIVVGLALPAITTNANAVNLTSIMAFAIVGLSVGIITGLGGQLSLGQFAVGAVGAIASYQVSSRIGEFPLAFLYAGLAGATASLVIGLPALRIKGLLLTVTTLGFASVATGWLLRQPWAFGQGVNPGRPIIGHTALDTGKQYYYVAFAALVVMTLLARNIRHSGLGRRLIAVRDNEDNARAFTVPAQLVKLQGFLLAGFVAGIGGAIFSHQLSHVGSAAFPISASINVVAMCVIGGMSLLVGPLLGAFYIIGVPLFLPLDSAGLAATQLGWLVLVLYMPGGIAQGIEPLRNRYANWAARRHNVVIADEVGNPEADMRNGLPALAKPATRLTPNGSVLLEAVELRKNFGGVAAVNGVSLHVNAGEIVGLIGPNGAGKTTTFELLGGFTKPDSGNVIFDGEDISFMGPEARAQRGLIRSFQDAALFPSLTVLESTRLAFERVDPTGFVPSVLGLQRAERRKEAKARELVDAMGLGNYRNKQIQELSTGTRRITEIACLIALEPTLLLLDEPSSGIAQRETEALGELLRQIKQELDLTMLIIEHDIPLIMGLSDRIVAMDAGAVIAAGAPEVVRNDPQVVEAYLGGSVTAIERSDTGKKAKQGRPGERLATH